jgi:transcription elongation factor SPT6
LAAEADHLVTVSIELSAASLHDLQSSLIQAFSSDSFSDTAKAWNEQRVLVIQEAVEKHLLPMGVKWIREWIRDEAQNGLAQKCGEILRQVYQLTHVFQNANDSHLAY